jgi:hypothetical protein
VATTVIDALADVYRGVGMSAVPPTPLPKLYVWQLEVTANRVALPYALLLQSRGADQLMVQKNPGTGGNAGIRDEVVWARFLIWSIDPPEADAAASRLTAALHPLSVVIVGATTVTQVLDSSVAEARHRPPRLGGRPIPRGNEVTTDRVYAANVDVKVRVAYA